MDFEFDKMPSHVEKRYLANVETLRKEMDFKKEQEADAKQKTNKYKDLFYDVRGDFSKLVRHLSQQGAFSYADTGLVIGKDKDVVRSRLEQDWKHQLRVKRKKDAASYNNG